MAETLIACENLVKIYKVANLEVVALQGLDLRVRRGEMMALVGASGSGKSTLLNILGGLDIPSAGHCAVAGYTLERATDADRLRYRRDVIGHLWQQSGRNLISHFSLQRNVEMPQTANDRPPGAARRHARELLELVGLGAMRDKRPDQLSGGEQQRAGIAVALANDPRLLLADEPTGELDSQSARQVVELLRRVNQELGLTVVLVTHDVAVAGEMDRTIAIRDGKTSTETVRRRAPLDGADYVPETASAVIGLSALTHRELILLDKAGRLQVPHAMVESLGLSERVEVREVGDHLEIWPVGDE